MNLLLVATIFLLIAIEHATNDASEAVRKDMKNLPKEKHAEEDAVYDIQKEAQRQTEANQF